MSLLALAGTNSATGGYEIANSCKFEDDNDEWLYRTNATGTNRKTWTVSWWFKQTELSTQRNSYTEIWQGGVFGEATRAGVDNNDRLWVDIGGGTGNTGTLFRSLSSARLRDTAAWYHVVIACDSTQSTEADRLKVWLNGEEVTAWDQRQYPTLNYESALQAAITMKWGSYDATYNGYSGYLAECNYVDGVTATQNDFGEYDEDTGIWKPKEYEGSYGTNGSYLDFEIANDLGANAKGNDVNFSLNNITSADQATDTPTNNFCTGNNLVRFTNPSGTVVVDGATFMQKGANGRETISGTMYASSGKWYAEVQPIYPTGNNFLIGVMPSDSPIIYLGGQISNFPGSASGDGGVSYISTGNKYLDGGNSSYGDAYSSGTSVGPVIGIALDMDNGKVYFAKSNTWQNSGDPTSGATGTGAIDLPSPEKSYSFHVSIYNSGNSVAINYGGYTYFTISSGESDANGYGTFEYAPPSGYYALCTKNLEEFG